MEELSKKIRVAIVGYGNIGKYSLQAIRSSKDLELVGIVRRPVSLSPKNNHNNCIDSDSFSNIKQVSDISELPSVQVAILCLPSRLIPEAAQKILSLGISTVDSFDIHGKETLSHYKALKKIGEKKGVASIISAGWDPGTDSVIRTLFLVMAPKGITYTNFGPGMSMGHSVVVRSKEGVKDAVSMTIPLGNGNHRRDVYVELKEGCEKGDVEKKIKEDEYFKNDDTNVYLVKDVNEVKDMGHGVLIERKGVSGLTQNQRFKFSMEINNPALTAQVLICCARAVVKQKPGCYTLPQIPMFDLIGGDLEDFIIHNV